MVKGGRPGNIPTGADYHRSDADGSRSADKVAVRRQVGLVLKLKVRPWHANNSPLAGNNLDTGSRVRWECPVYRVGPCATGPVWSLLDSSGQARVV
jgi:hypothetical protein